MATKNPKIRKPAAKVASKPKRGVKPLTEKLVAVVDTAEQSQPESESAVVAPVDHEVGQVVASQTTDADKTALEENLSKKSTGLLEAPVRIFQIYFEPWQRELLDSSFIALDNSKSTSEFLEFDVFLRLAKSEYVKGADLWGGMSWRYTEKTGMTGQDLVKAIESNPGFDVYYCNPVPENEALYHNQWLHGETCHPQFFALCQAIFTVTGLPLESLISIEPSASNSTANYFVGSPKFWETYLPWVQSVINLANKKLPPKVRDFMHSSLADDRNLHGGASYVPFIVERLFPVFMKTVGKDLKAHKIPLPERDRQLNVHVRLLREMKDVAHRTKSAWLAACWVNYRNLYLTQTKGKAWCDKYLKTITPGEIRFG